MHLVNNVNISDLKTSNIIKIAPSILSAYFSKLGSEIEIIYRAGANVLLSGFGIFKGNIEENIKGFKDIVK